MRLSLDPIFGTETGPRLFLLNCAWDGNWVAPRALQTGSGAANRTFNLDLIDRLGEQLSPSQAADLLYDLDNLQVLAPFWNQAR